MAAAGWGRASSTAASHGAAAAGRFAVTTLPWSRALVVRGRTAFFYFFQHFKNVATFCKLLEKKLTVLKSVGKNIGRSLKNEKNVVQHF
jgi:hypothetical protein